jgi:uncharacterized protein (DUF2267 family)
MDELVKAIAEQAGLPEAKARQAAEAAIKFLKDKLPGPIAGQVDAALNKPGIGKGAEDLLKKGKGLFGNK